MNELTNIRAEGSVIKKAVNAFKVYENRIENLGATNTKCKTTVIAIGSEMAKNIVFCNIF